MEAALLSGFLNTILTKLLCLAEEKYKVYNGVKDDLVFLEKELRMISGFIDEKLSSEGDDLSHVEKTWIEELRKLSHGIEDCIDNLMYLAIRKRQAPLWLQIGRYLSTQQSFQKLAEKLKRLKNMPAEEHERGGRYRTVPSSTQLAGCLSSSWSDQHSLEAVEKNPVGIDTARDELVAQLEVKAQDQQMRLKVVAIVGLPGSGKTLLARAVYESQTSKEGFDLRVWVRAAKRGPREVLMEILRQLGAPLPTLAADHLDVHLRGRLMHKRYLIVIDDMQTDQWNTIASSFPDDEQFGSRILVTTTVLSVANACCSTNGYVFKMRKLGEEQSKALFLKKACPEYYLEYADLHSRQILEKCDGQALALVTVGQYLRKTGWPTEHSFDNPCHQLRCELLEDKTLERIRRVLVRTYASLPGHAPRACLMYFGMFPCDRPVRRKNLMRLWLAEGFLGAQPLYAAMELAAKNFDKLIDHNIIEPIEVSNNNKVKTCKTYGMMHEFILIKSISQDIIALFGDEKLKFKPCHVRRLCLHSSNAYSETNLDVDFSLVRSLTVFGEARTTILDFNKYKLLRVLNLEECTADLGNKNLKHICKLRLLKYLSLGVTVTHIPRQIEKLRLLETLDLRRTEVSILPIEVLLLPRLIHLFGKFQLPKKVRRKGDVPNFLLSGESQLETLAGFIITDKRQVFAQIMRYMKKLSKVKIWCDGTTTSDEFVHLSDAIQTFIHDKKDGSNDARSLAVHINEFSDGLLDSLKDPCYLTSLKLQGKLVKLPRFVQLLRGLTELCIQSTELNTHLLGQLGGLKSLRYLKLIADQLEEFTISDQSFPMLLHFCLVLECSTLPKIKQGALKYLTSLKVMCKGLIGLCGMKIEYLNCLKEITLHAEVNPRAQEEWVEAARKHPNRPNILLLKKDDQIANEPPEHSVASVLATNVRVENFAVFDEPAEEKDTQMLLNHCLQSPFLMPHEI